MRHSVDSDYRNILKRQLDMRCEQNANYSLRAFARDLQVSPSRLSEILNRKQGLSRKAAIKFCHLLGLTGEERDYFCDLVTSQHARSKNDRETARIRLLKNQAEADAYYQLQHDTFKVISDWYHIGILELMKLDDFVNDAKWIARRLQITPMQAELAVDRLVRVGLLAEEKGDVVAKQNTGLLKGGVPSESIKKFHRQILGKAIDALILQSTDEREFSVNTMAIDKRHLPAAKKQIQKFQERFCSDIKSSPTKDSLYCLSIQFFNLARERS